MMEAPKRLTTQQVRWLLANKSARTEVGPDSHPRFGWTRLHASWQGQPVSYIFQANSLNWILEANR